MNKTQFKKAMINGLGRCVQYLGSAPDKEKYRDIVLWGCTHELSLDSQSEGSRAEYVYRLTRCFDAPKPFVAHTIAALHSCPRTQDWRFQHICELLSYFAQDSTDVRDALHGKLDELYAILCSERKIKTYDFERERFTDIAIALVSAEGRGTYRKISAMLDELYAKKPEYSPHDFAWFYEYAAGKFGKRAVKPEHLPCYTGGQPSPVPTAAEMMEAAKKGVVPVRMHIRFRGGADADAVMRVARYISETPDIAQKAKLLETFRFVPWPLDAQELISYAKGENGRLSDAAFAALENCRSEAVRDFAKECLLAQHRTLPAFRILTANYAPEDRQLLLETLVALSDEEEIHSAGRALLEGFHKGHRLPKQALAYIYENGRCSYCRCEVVREMAKHRWLTPELIEECRCDSYEDTRNYVNRYYPKK